MCTSQEHKLPVALTEKNMGLRFEVCVKPSETEKSAIEIQINILWVDKAFSCVRFYPFSCCFWPPKHANHSQTGRQPRSTHTHIQAEQRMGVKIPRELVLPGLVDPPRGTIWEQLLAREPTLIAKHRTRLNACCTRLYDLIRLTLLGGCGRLLRAGHGSSFVEHSKATQHRPRRSSQQRICRPKRAAGGNAAAKHEV